MIFDHRNVECLSVYTSNIPFKGPTYQEHHTLKKCVWRNSELHIHHVFLYRLKNVTKFIKNLFECTKKPNQCIRAISFSAESCYGCDWNQDLAKLLTPRATQIGPQRCSEESLSLRSLSLSFVFLFVILMLNVD